MCCVKKVLISLIVFLVGQPVLAGTATGTLPVTASVLSNCVLGNINSVNFGNYDPTLVTPLTATGSIAVQCTTGTPYNIGLNAGTGAGATVTNRLMTRTPTPGTLGYGLFQNSAHTINWGNTVGTDTVSGTGTAAAQTSTVYGQIPNMQQAATAGSYSDNVTITVTF